MRQWRGPRARHADLNGAYAHIEKVTRPAY
jgi:hypothetical protein